jgi:hypothetical protein
MNGQAKIRLPILFDPAASGRYRFRIGNRNGRSNPGFFWYTHLEYPRFFITGSGLARSLATYGC